MIDRVTVYHNCFLAALSGCSMVRENSHDHIAKRAKEIAIHSMNFYLEGLAEVNAAIRAEEEMIEQKARIEHERKLLAEKKAEIAKAKNNGETAEAKSTSDE